ncbi:MULTISPECIES: hypothetical protein [unclassified Pseudoclavibacter]|uniref:hypothetical protein n=1 Tax=unclassified Pseudoclavibacter TaxID=2615177 RepID=UPI0013019182|nr:MULTISPECIES: hypothetical protein [unclassified Pseudoclavibacter]KAB1647271.1 hypothetical protein F8O06_01480 [Pseudoclavibacter sp. CFCC 14310]KAB1662736.1 hypothetical protein F8O08_09185 [Pseudoclavibacter sp. CFCC 13611]
MSIRRASLAALVVALVSVGAAGCSYATPVATERTYNASDGIVIGVGDVTLSNIALISDDEGSQARLIGQVATSGTKAASVTLTIEGQQPISWNVEPNQPIDLETTENEHVLTDLGAKPGATLRAKATADGQTEDQKTIPVIAGHLKEYSSLVPSSEPSSPAAISSSETPSPNGSTASTAPNEAATPSHTTH